MGPLSYMRSIVDRSVVMRRIYALGNLKCMVQLKQKGRWAPDTSVTVSVFCDRQWTVCGGDHDA